MDFVKFNYIISVADLRSISLAAKKCFISQPALTRCINKIEEELGVKLFDRTTSPLTLTYAGERYLAGIRNLCAMKYALDKEMEDISQLRKGRMVVGIPNTRGTTWLPQILPLFQSKYPGIDLRLIEGTSDDLEKLLLKEEIDLILIATIPFGHPGLEFEIVATEQLMFVLPYNHPIFAEKTLEDHEWVLHFVKPEYFDNQPFISVTPAQGLYRAANQIFENLGIHPRMALETSNTSTAFYLASSGLGFTIAPVSSAYTERSEHRPVFCTFNDPPVERSIVVAYKKDRPVSLAMRQLIDIVKHQAAVCPALHVPSFDVTYDVCPASCAD